MKYENIIIRTKEAFDKSKPVVQTALRAEALSKAKPEFPLVYKYLGSARASDKNDIHPEDVIGTITNIRFDASGDVVCDVNVNDIMEKSRHFCNIVDNVVVGMVETRNNRRIPMIVNAVIYDKFAKSVIDKRTESKSTSNNVVKMDETPIDDKVALDKDINPLMRG